MLFTVLFLVSCGDELKIEPEQSLSIDASFSDENTSRASLNGVYSLSQDLDVFGAMPQIINDFMFDNVNFIGSFPTLQDVNNFATISDNLTTSGIFRDHYAAILAANSVVHFVPLIEDETFVQESRDEIVAEAKYLRAILYFNLVNLFAEPYLTDNGASPGLAIITVPDVLLEGAKTSSRNSVAEVYAQIEQDLMDAEAGLTDSADKYRATTVAASGMLSRLYLYKGDWDGVIRSANKVIDNAAYQLASNYDFYNTPSIEAVFSLNMSSIDNSATGSGGWANFYSPAPLGGRGDCPFDSTFLALHEEGDLRISNLTQESIEGPIKLLYTAKFPDAQNNSDDAPIQRVTEVHLNLAEAITRNNDAVEQSVIDILNPIRERAGLSTFSTDDFDDADDLLETILDERRKELAFEGHHRNDVLRTGAAPDNDKNILPIPQREIDLGSSLPQNPGY